MTREEFQSLVDRYLSGEATSQEKKLIDNFFSALGKSAPSEENVPDVEMWESIEEKLFQPVESHPAPQSRRPFLATALILFIGLAGSLLYYNNTKNREVEWISEVAPNGKKITLTLTDGTKVSLNSGSTLSYPKEFCPTIREVKLTGEAFFDVTRNTSKPFVVRTGNLTTRVLGTSFNIHAFDGRDISVTVATGKVQVEALVTNKVSSISSKKLVTLSPSQRAVFKNDEFITSKIELEKFLAWRNNTLRFEEATLADVVDELQRWYDIRINFQTNTLLNCRINGQFKDQSLEEVLKSIQYMYNIDYKLLTQNQIILYGKGCGN